MAGGKEDGQCLCGSSKRQGSAYASKRPENSLDAMLDFYLTHPTSAQLSWKDGAVDDTDYDPAEFSTFVSPEHNHSDNLGDPVQGSAGRADTSWADDRT